MTSAAPDPYAVLGVRPDASDDELRRVHRTLVKRHHPDHNGGSAESATRFAQIQEAYAAILRQRRAPAPVADPAVEDRIADLERELRAKRAAERRAAKAPAPPRRPTPEELGYYSTQDSFTKIIDDAADELIDRIQGSDRKRQFSRRLSELFGNED